MNVHPVAGDGVWRPSLMECPHLECRHVVCQHLISTQHRAQLVDALTACGLLDQCAAYVAVHIVERDYQVVHQVHGRHRARLDDLNIELRTCERGSDDAIQQLHTGGECARRAGVLQGHAPFMIVSCGSPFTSGHVAPTRDGSPCIGHDAFSTLSPRQTSPLSVSEACDTVADVGGEYWMERRSEGCVVSSADGTVMMTSNAEPRSTPALRRRRYPPGKGAPPLSVICGCTMFGISRPSGKRELTIRAASSMPLNAAPVASTHSMRRPGLVLVLKSAESV